MKVQPPDGEQLRDSDLDRDLHADLDLCRAATCSGWLAIRESDEWGTLGTPVCRMYDDESVVVGHPHDWGPGSPPAADAAFIAASRSGWPVAIRRALAAEVEVERLRAVLKSHGLAES